MMVFPVLLVPLVPLALMDPLVSLECPVLREMLVDLDLKEDKVFRDLEERTDNLELVEMMENL